MLPVNEKQIIHSYSDQASFADINLPCYSLEEVIAEKIRAVGGQRRFAVSRDLYDIYNLISTGIDVNAVKQILPRKFEIKGLTMKGIDVNNIKLRRSAFELDWERRLGYLVTKNNLEFETVWQHVLLLLDEVTVENR